MSWLINFFVVYKDKNTAWPIQNWELYNVATMS